VNKTGSFIDRPAVGLMNPIQYHAVAIRSLLTYHPHGPAHALVGKTLVSSGMSWSEVALSTT
jgi:phosphoglucomutase